MNSPLDLSVDTFFNRFSASEARDSLEGNGDIQCNKCITL